MKNKISRISKLLLLTTSLLLLISIFVPIWRIELDAPQYPEGLMMQIYSNKLGGQVDIINGLNHYIGMQTLHAENFIEFTVLPYIIVFYVLLILTSALIGRKKLLYISFYLFLLFGIIAMVDFWRWEYNYGHNLDPNAAIIVPGMSYQPPLIGFKQLLNFGAYSIPDIGGWLFITGGLLMLVAILVEIKLVNKIFNKKSINHLSLLFFILLGLNSCNNSKSKPINLNKDKCDFCGMTISDYRFCAELITQKGRVYKFDDLHCLQGYERENTKSKIASYFISDYSQSNILIDATKAYYVEHENIKSPMRGNTAAFKTKEAANEFANKHNTEFRTWDKLNQQ